VPFYLSAALAAVSAIILVFPPGPAIQKKVVNRTDASGV